MSERLVITHGDDGPIVESLWRGVPHNRNLCLGCDRSVMKIAIHRLVYTFEPCDCEEVSYHHLVERLWHPACYRANASPADPEWDAATARMRIDAGPVELVQSPTDPGDIGEPRIVSEDGVTYVVVPDFEHWGSSSGQDQP